MDVTATGTDVSSPGLREYLSGARLLVGTIGASALMLLACSWFALGTGVFGSSRDVGRPDPVRIGASTPAQAATAAKSDLAPISTRRVDVGAPRPHRPGVTSPRNVRNGNGNTAQSEAATGRAPVPGEAKPAAAAAAAPAAPSSPATPAPPQQTVVVPEVTLPAPLDEVQVPSPPPVPVTPPAVPPAVPPVQVTVGPVSVGIP
jgi:translation initiation factor IF-2